jgi:tetratricopeptide (TPR) repeat protein
MPRFRRALPGLCVLVLGLGARVVVAAAPTQADVDLAKAHYKTGELNYERGNFTDAAKEFEEAYRLTGRAELLYNMGKSYDGAGDMRGALAAYRRFLAAVRTSPDRPFCERRVSELEVLIARIEVEASVAGAAVTLDGTRLGTTPLEPRTFEINPGEHKLEIAAEGYATWRKTLRLERAQREKVSAQLVSLVKVIRVSDKAVPVYKRWYLWTAVGLVVAAGVVTGAVLGVRAANEIDGPSLQLPVVR